MAENLAPARRQRLLESPTTMTPRTIWNLLFLNCFSMALIWIAIPAFYFFLCLVFFYLTLPLEILLEVAEYSVLAVKIVLSRFVLPIGTDISYRGLPAGISTAQLQLYRSVNEWLSPLRQAALDGFFFLVVVTSVYFLSICFLTRTVELLPLEFSRISHLNSFASVFGYIKKKWERTVGIYDTLENVTSLKSWDDHILYLMQMAAFFTGKAYLDCAYTQREHFINDTYGNILTAMVIIEILPIVYNAKPFWTMIVLALNRAFHVFLNIESAHTFLPGPNNAGLEKYEKYRGYMYAVPFLLSIFTILRCFVRGRL